MRKKTKYAFSFGWVSSHRTHASQSRLWRGVLDTTLFNKVCQWFSLCSDSTENVLFIFATNQYHLVLNNLLHIIALRIVHPHHTYELGEHAWLYS
jgi:hypothetical protein